MYRDAGLQVVPAHYPMRTASDKRPSLSGWKEFQTTSVPESTFNSWFPDNKPNMGVITGAISGNLIVIDIDDYRSGLGAEWWQSITNDFEPETWCQTTGGGGRQYFFRAPEGYVTPTGKTPIADIRGEGGFAMLPPSKHYSGKEYAWQPHRSPWDIPLADITPDMLAAITELLDHYGRSGLTRTSERVPSASEHDAFGNLVDGREDHMTRVVWGAILNLKRRMGDIEVEEDIGADACREAFNLYLRNTRTRLQNVENAQGLEMEGRGWSLFQDKWKTGMRKWTGKVALEAEKNPVTITQVLDGTSQIQTAYPSGTFELIDVAGIKAMPDPTWLIDTIMVERALGFIYGPPGCGKTFIALSMALGIAADMGDWWGRDINRTGAVVYISSEGQADLKFRIMAWEQANKVLTDDSPFYLLRQSINFMDEGDIATLITTLDFLQKETGIEIAAVFIDTVSRTLPGADENLQKDMTMFIRGCDMVQARFNAAVVGVHHTSRAGGAMRGSTVLDGAGDFIVQVEREEGETLGTMTAKKIKAARDGWQQFFRLEQTPCGDISGNTSLVAMPHDPPKEEERPSSWPDRELCKIILADLDKAWTSGDPWSSFPQSKKMGRYAPRIINTTYGVSAKTADDMVETWLINRVISVEIRNSHDKTKGLKLLKGID